MTRKLLTLTLAALAFGATQAANINWDKVSGHVDLGQKTSSGTIGVGSGEGQANLGSGSWTISAFVTTTTLSAYNQEGQKYPSFIGIGWAGNKGDALRFNANCNGAASGSIGLSGTSAPSVTGDSVTFQSNSSYEFVISYDSATKALNFYLNGNLYGTVASFNQTLTDIVWGQHGATATNMNLWNNNANNITMDIDYVAGMTYDQVIAASEAPDPDPSVPEPTALALLALGVAGVALRRRVA